MNKVILVGRFTRDPELSHTNSNMAFCKFSLAANRPFKNKNGEYEADFPNCVAWDKTAELISKHFLKGNRIGIVGRLQTGSYENKDGNKVYTTDVVVESFEFVESKSHTVEADEREAIQSVETSLPFDL